MHLANMFVIYTPETQQFLQCVVPRSNTLWLEWDNEIHKSGILYTKEDAIMMADDVQQIRATDEIFHYSVQVLLLDPDKQPNFTNPVYELIALTKIN